LILYIEGGLRFGDLPASRLTRLGGALLQWELWKGESKAVAPLLVYRGGFIRFLQPRGAPGVAGEFEFWDGKGRIRHGFGGYTKEFKLAVTDMGSRLFQWSAKSGKTKTNPSTPGGNYNIGGGFGHVPPGWWRQYRSSNPFTYKQRDQSTGIGNSKKIRQGGYVRWKQDDEPNSISRYSIDYRYDAKKAHDRAIGEPSSIMFKYDMDPIYPTRPQGRSAIQIHPDGECNDAVMGGTAGCIGIQTYRGCKNIHAVLQRYHGLKLKVQLK